MHKVYSGIQTDRIGLNNDRRHASRQMMIGKNTAKWIEQLQGNDSPIKRQAAEHLLGVSEHYFEHKSISISERESALKRIEGSIFSDDPRVRQSVIYIATILRVWNRITEQLIERGLRDRDSLVLSSALYAAACYKESVIPLLKPILDQSEHLDREVRWRVPWAIREIQACPPDGQARLIGLTRIIMFAWKHSMPLLHASMRRTLQYTRL